MPIPLLAELLKSVLMVSAGVFTYWLWNRDRSRSSNIAICRSIADWKDVSEHFFAYVHDGLLGVDCEWVSTRSGPNKIALLQLAANRNFCVLIRLTHMEIPAELAKVLADHNVIKFGVGIMDDAKKLQLDYGIKMNGCLDLRYMALEKDPELKGSGNLSLADLAMRFARMKLDKSSDIRTSNWEAEQLSEAQIQYAAEDAVAGLVTARSIIRGWLMGSLYDSCVAEFHQFIDKPFRRSPVNRNIQKFHTKMNRVRELRRAPVTRNDQVVYKNAVMKAPDGEVLCNTDVTKVLWYLRMNLASLECQDPLVIRLNFEPRGRAVLGGEYYADEKQNLCVVCGSEKFLLKKNVVPSEYRKLFPVIMKTHTSHDSVLVCIDCQQRSSRYDAALRSTLESECPNDVATPRFQNIKRVARALLSAGDRLPQHKTVEYTELLEDYFRVPLSTDVLKHALELDESRWLRDNGLTHAQRVVAKYSKREGLFALETRFRQHFLDTMQPKYLSPKWSVTHNHDAVLLKMATGRYAGPDTFDAFLKSLGVSWARVAQLITAVLQQRLVEPHQIVVWNQLRQAGYDIADVAVSRASNDQ